MLDYIAPSVNPTLQPGLFDTAIQAPLLSMEDSLDLAIARADEMAIANVELIAEVLGITDAEEAAYIAYELEEAAGEAAYLACMLEEESAGRSVNWHNVYTVQDAHAAAYADAKYVDLCQSEYTDWRD